MSTRKILILVTAVVLMLFSCKDDGIIKRIEETKAMALDAKEKAESIKAEVSYSEIFEQGNASVNEAESAFEAEEFEKSLSDYEAAVNYYNSSYENAKKARDKALDAMNRAQSSIKQAEENAAAAEAAKEEAEGE